MRTVSSKAAARGAIPAYWQERLARSQVVAPTTSELVSPLLTANLKAKWPSRARKSSPEPTLRSSLSRRRSFASPPLRGSGP